jgi:uncharacterized protein YgbK (DUF1537 family)
MGELDCVGIAGASRSMAPPDMESELRPVAEFFAALGAPVTHYKTCSTFDSAPEVGSIAVALRVLSGRISGRFIPIVGGQPNIGRYCVFGNLFAAAEAGGPALRIDRHPMSRHPVTPMMEADLRAHIERQGLKPIRSVPYPSYEMPTGSLDDVVRRAREGAGAVLFDVSRPADLAAIGRVIWNEAKQHGLVAAGPSGVTQALCAHWHKSGEVEMVTKPSPVAAAEGPVFVMAGSLSPVTRRQIEAATTFKRVAVDVAQLTRGDKDYVNNVVWQVSELMNSGQSVIMHTSPLDDEPRDETLMGVQIAKATGAFVSQLLAATQCSRIGIAGGDTSSWTLRALDVWGLSFIGHLAPGVALCRMHSSDENLDGIEIMLKGGQMGQPDLFVRLRDGC